MTDLSGREWHTAAELIDPELATTEYKGGKFVWMTDSLRAVEDARDWMAALGKMKRAGDNLSTLSNFMLSFDVRAVNGTGTMSRIRFVVRYNPQTQHNPTVQMYGNLYWGKQVALGRAENFDTFVQRWLAALDGKDAPLWDRAGYPYLKEQKGTTG